MASTPSAIEQVIQFKGNITEKLPEPRVLVNPMSTHWDIQLYYGTYPNESRKVFFAVFTSLITPSPEKYYALISELYGDKRGIINSLRKFGVVLEHRYDALLAYIEERLIAKDYLVLDGDDLSVIEGLDDSDVIDDSYKILCEYVYKNLEVFPSSFDEFASGISEGVFTANEILIERSVLEDILGVSNKIEIENILRGLRRIGYLTSGNHKKLTDRVTVGVNTRKNLYRFLIPPLSATSSVDE